MGRRPSRKERQDCNRAELIKSAMRLFAERGISGVSLDAVAEAAGMTKGAVYSNFKNKEELIFAVLDDCMPNLDSSPISVADDIDVDQKYKMLGEAYAQLINSPERRQFAMFVMEFWLFSMRNPMARERFLPILRSVGRQWESARVPPGHPLEGLPDSQLSGIASAVDFGIGIHSLLDAEGFPPEIYGPVMKLIFSDVRINGSASAPGAER